MCDVTHDITCCRVGNAIHFTRQKQEILTWSGMWIWHPYTWSLQSNEHITSLSSHYTCQWRPSSLPLVQCLNDNVTHAQTRQVNMDPKEKHNCRRDWAYIQYSLGAFNTQLNRKVKTRFSPGLWIWMRLDISMHSQSHLFHFHSIVFLIYFIIIIFNEANRTESGK